MKTRVNILNRTCLAGTSFLLMGLFWTYLFGKDFNFDFRNYHLYSGAALVQWRLNQDYFPAAVSSYLNSIVELPVYWLVMAGWNDLLVASIFTLIHLPNLYIIWKIARLVVGNSGKMAFFSCYAATLLAFIAPIQLTTLSNTFGDPTAGTFLLLGVYMLLRASREDGTAHYTWTGILFGIGAGLKLTNLIFLPAGLIAIAFGTYRLRRNYLNAGFRYSFGTVLGFGLTNGWWAYALWRKFGNPIFPLYNAIFKSPDFLAKNFSDARMLNDGHWSWATLPFTMLSSQAMVYSENPAPDIRLLCAIVIFLIVSLTVFYSRLKKLKVNGSVNVHPDELKQSRASLWTLLVFFGVGYLTWGLLSGIARYAYSLWLLLGPVFIGLLFNYTSAPVTRIVTTLALVIQLVIQFLNPGLVWSPYKWGGQWVNLRVPQPLRDTPATYILYGVQSNSFIVPYLHPESRFSNAIGQYVQPVGSKMHEQFKTFLRTPGPLKIVLGMREATAPSRLSETSATEVNALMSGYGYKLAKSECQKIELMSEPLPKTIEGDWQVGWSQRRANVSNLAETFLVCDLVELSEREKKSALDEYQKADAVFNAVEHACGDILSPHGVQTVNGKNVIYRVYFNSQIQLKARAGGVLIHPIGTMLEIPVGSYEEILSKGSATCPDVNSIKKDAKFSVERAERTSAN